MVILLLGGIGFLPLFGGPGYEASLAAGLVLPSSAAVAVALEVSRRRVSPFDAYGRGVALGCCLAVVALVISVLHGLRAGFCDLAEGTTLFCLAPAVGSVVGGAWGAAAGLIAERVRGPRRKTIAAIALALAGPLAGALVSLWRFLASPMVFGFDPFFGYFSGPLYDTVIDATERLITYRMGTLFSLIAGGVFFWHLRRNSSGLALQSRGRPGIVFAGALALAASLAHAGLGFRLGHWSSVQTIETELERTLHGQRCDVFYSPNVLERDAELTMRDCDAHVAELEAWFETQGPPRITVFLFESEAQKGRLMGATGTLIAKPWRREIYIQALRYPHPVLRHELAHVVSGSFAPGPFRVAGPLGGWLPNPGRIEGAAVAAAPDDSELTLQEWARAMLELRILPPLSSIFRLTFLGENSSKAYTVAGAFISWLHETYGARVLRDWYGGGELQALTGKDLQSLEGEWHASLRVLPFPERALETARARFDRPAIFARKCPRVVDRLIADANGQLSRGDWRGAKDSFDKALALDGDHVGARLGLGTCAERAGDDAEARRRWAAVAEDKKLHEVLRMMGVEQEGDLDLVLGNLVDAQRQYDEVASALVDEDQLRTLEVKAHPGSEIARQAIASLLVGDPRLGRDFGEAAARIGRWSEAEPENGLPAYLLGRNFYNSGRYEEAEIWLESSPRANHRVGTRAGRKHSDATHRRVRPRRAGQSGRASGELRRGGFGPPGTSEVGGGSGAALHRAVTGSRPERGGELPDETPLFGRRRHSRNLGEGGVGFTDLRFELSHGLSPGGVDPGSGSGIEQLVRPATDGPSERCVAGLVDGNLSQLPGDLGVSGPARLKCRDQSAVRFPYRTLDRIFGRDGFEGSRDWIFNPEVGRAPSESAGESRRSSGVTDFVPSRPARGADQAFRSSVLAKLGAQPLEGHDAGGLELAHAREMIPQRALAAAASTELQPSRSATDVAGTELALHVERTRVVHDATVIAGVADRVANVGTRERAELLAIVEPKAALGVGLNDAIGDPAGVLVVGIASRSVGDGTQVHVGDDRGAGIVRPGVLADAAAGDDRLGSEHVVVAACDENERRSSERDQKHALEYATKTGFLSSQHQKIPNPRSFAALFICETMLASELGSTARNTVE